MPFFKFSPLKRDFFLKFTNTKLCRILKNVNNYFGQKVVIHKFKIYYLQYPVQKFFLAVKLLNSKRHCRFALSLYNSFFYFSSDFAKLVLFSLPFSEFRPVRTVKQKTEPR